ncbi:uncharacterized protein LOC126741056 isoform X3 [Anthonomus grandis grandis]|uniref:uncharacterized protein LOC126741056 isoform X3 n=1 Tax=Anthonomus grandis grandis TaxID=2921223 RepID=UPI0021653C57|nr:uncharacterized protein LOC126741056 isoform X3 [Anthonomus grandis grandis]
MPKMSKKSAKTKKIQKKKIYLSKKLENTESGNKDENLQNTGKQGHGQHKLPINKIPEDSTSKVKFNEVVIESNKRKSLTVIDNNEVPLSSKTVNHKKQKVIDSFQKLSHTGEIQNSDKMQEDTTINHPTKFELALREGPTIVCSCCMRLWFSTSCRKIDLQMLENKFGNQFTTQICNDGVFFCNSCSQNIYKGQLPKFWSGNHNIVHPIPVELKDLTILEERMVSARLPFMQIRQVGYARQCYITGQIVNVPINIDTSTKLLPRNVEETQTIQVKLKRKMNYKNDYLLETIRPAVVLKAAKFLCQQPLYIQEGIKQSDDWEKNINDYIRSQVESSAQILNEGSKVVELDSKTVCSENFEELFDNAFFETMEVPLESKNDDKNIQKESSIEKNNIYNLEEFLDEEEEPLNPGGQETLLDKCNLENICFAPGEGKTPIHLMLDQFSDELSFPTLFCGHAKQFLTKFSYSDQTKIQLQHKDRRFARTDYLLYTFKKRQLIQLSSAIATCLRKKRNEDGKYTAGQVRQANFLDQLIRSDMGFHFLSRIAGSPAYWKHEKTKLLCMIRQFGIPTLFFTVSAAETAWPELIKVLAQVVDQKDVTLEEAASMPYLEKTRLIRTDPITCARYFDYRFKLLFKHMKSQNGPFKQNPIEHHYYRIEFQHRGSPHVHGLLWLSNAPKFQETPESFKECAEFANRYITCNSDLESVRDIIQFNTHHHSKSCQKEVRGHKVCRYGIPFLPMDKSVILTPIKIDKTKEADLRKAMSEKFLMIMRRLKDKPDLSFENFLADLGMSKDEYLNVIQHNIFKTTLFLERLPKDGFINNFNAEMFSMMKSNMDIQLVFEPYGCCTYIVNYINKSQRGVSDILMKTMEEIKKGNLDVKGKLKSLAAAFLNASEVSAQEAAYSVLQLPMHDTCTSYVYIHTNPIRERTKMLKPLAQLKEMDNDDPNIYCDGLIEHYEQRPDEMENICLAEFAAYYDFFKKQAETKANGLPLKDGSGVLVKRGHAKILAYRSYGLQQDPLNYYREQIMLYIPWRNEVDEVENDNIDQQTIYKDRYQEIVANRQKFNVLNEQVIDEALKLAEDRSNQLDDGGFGGEIDDEFMPYGLDKPIYDPFNHIIDKKDDEAPVKHIAFPTPHQISDSEYEALISKLNHKQYQFLNVVQDSLIEGETFYCTLSGPAGTGKSHLITAITQSLLRHFNSIPGNNPESLKVLLCAPTGKAAFNIGGITLHAALSLPVSQYGEELIPLHHDTVNTIYCNLCDLKLIIVDEYSMVGARLFDHINSRLQQIFKSDAIFGNISIILCGDNRQLPPVRDMYIFCPVKTNPYKELCGTYLWDHFKYFELSEIMRQSEDKSFAVALNNMAFGKMTDEDVQLIKSREVDSIDQIPEDTMHLFCTNAEVDAFNEMKLSTFKTERAVSQARDVIKGSCSERLKNLFLEHAKSLKKGESFGLMLNLILQVDAKYMISMNVDTSDGIVNGATGILRQIDYDRNKIPFRVWMEFFDSKSGQECRKRNESLKMSMGVLYTWTPIEKAARAIKVQKGSNVHVERLQFPLVISEGITIHKSQGATYKQVAVHVGNRMTRTSTYVACSRATKLSGLYIIGNFKAPKPVTEKDAAYKELVNMQENKLITSRKLRLMTILLLWYRSFQKRTSNLWRI